MASLTSLQLLQKVALYELLKETTPYLLHPNLWIRQATAAFVASTASTLDGVDVVVKLGTFLNLCSKSFSTQNKCICFFIHEFVTANIF